MPAPTMYHLLMPNERPGSFTKSRLDHDQELLGFSWQITPSQTKAQQNTQQGLNSVSDGYLFDTTSIKAIY
ncbi:hypothetical protein [Colwellia sp. TT2012]|uniref:hypothetical protein n=1 Tax=Colwellia sp. TT2012 TaxID=1720342 RepID=UPI00070AB2DA|nr:hypothetical protein [Colwellia sp. TT2012]